MKNNCAKIMVLILAVVMLCGTAALAEQEKPLRGGPVDKPGYRKMSPEVIDRIMEMLKESDPEKAGELAKLREKDPEAFQEEIRKNMRRRRPVSRRKERAGDMEKSRFGKGEGMGWHRPVDKEPTDADILKWLKANEPEQAAELTKLEKENPRLYQQKLRMVNRKYGKIIAMAERHPELAALLKKDIQLQEIRNDLVNQIRATSDDAKKQQLTKQLESVVTERFDLLINMKQLKYEMLKEKLDKLKVRLEERQAEVTDLKAKKDENIQERMKELTSKTEKMKWD